MALFYTILFFLFIAFVIYKIYIDWYYITKKRKFNKSEDAINWYIHSNPFNRFIFGVFNVSIFKKTRYKILKEDDEIELMMIKS